MVETCLSLGMCEEDQQKLTIRGVNQVENSPIVRGKGRPRKTIGEIIKKLFRNV